MDVSELAKPPPDEVVRDVVTQRVDGLAGDRR